MLIEEETFSSDSPKFLKDLICRWNCRRALGKLPRASLRLAPSHTRRRFPGLVKIGLIPESPSAGVKQNN